MSPAPEMRRTEPLKIAAVRDGSSSQGDRRERTDTAGSFIDLEIAARRAPSLHELRFAVTNGWRRLVPLDQALLCEPGFGDEWSVTLAAGVVSVDQNAPLVAAAVAWLRGVKSANRAGTEPRVVDLTSAGTPAITARHALWLPLKRRNGHVVAGSLLLRNMPWQPHEQALLMPLSDAYAHAWTALAPDPAVSSNVRGWLTRKRLLIAGALAIGLAALVPVPMSALAPAEIVAADPAIVTAPIDGVLAEILFPPGSTVKKGDVIARFVDVKAKNDVEIASRNVAVAAARYFRTVQTATANAKDAQELAVMKSEWEIAKAEFSYARDVLARSELRAERDGLLIYSAKSDWIGKPLSTGERVMEIGDPKHVEVRIDLPVSDSLVLQPGNRMSLFLDGNPLNGISGTIRRTSYRPTLTPDQQLVFRIFATFDDASERRIGLRGTARVSSESVPFAFYLFRRPIAAVRQRVGI